MRRDRHARLGTPVTGGFYGRWSDLGFERLAEARGSVAIPPAKEVRLALAEGVEGLGEGLGLLEPDDLQQVATDRYRNSVTWTDEGGMAHMARCARLTNMFIPPGVTWRGAAHLHGLPLVTTGPST